ncbi:MAG: hypothetical protein AB1757_12690 [Acidobacteriota bacterium]
MMNVKEKTKNDRSNFQMDALTDLPVAEGQAEETKGGVLRGDGGRDVLIGGWGQDWIVGGTGRD